MTSVFAPAYAKINLTLDVLGKRADGYHRLASVMQTIALHDTLRVILSTGEPTLRFTCDATDLAGPENLVARAMTLLRDETPERRMGAEIELQKAIPTQAGLGGGSSDAACALTTLNALWGLGLSVERLETLGARLGSDVPFFAHGGSALIEGRGEVVTPLPDAEPLWLVLAKPRIGVSTAAVFRALTPTAYTTGAETHALVDAIRAGEPLPFERLSNALEAGVMRAYPAVAAARERLVAAGAPVVRMSGSGPTVFAPFRSLAEAAAVFAHAQATIATTSAAGAEPDAPALWLTHTVTAAASAPLPRDRDG